MQHDPKQDAATSPAAATHSPAEAPVSVNPRVELATLLRRAAQLAADHGIELDAYMSVAWSTYVEARPGLREQLEEVRLTAELAELRKLGKVGQA